MPRAPIISPPNTSRRLEKLSEPSLAFGYGQETEDPRDGLTLFGPLQEDRPFGIRAACIGTEEGIAMFENWVNWAQLPVANESAISRPPFPGFQAAFRIPWDPRPAITRVVSREELEKQLYLDDVHLRVYGLVNIFADRILDAKKNDEATCNVWFVVIPDEVKKYGRPLSVVPPDLRQKALRHFGAASVAKRYTDSLFPQLREDATPYSYEQHFRNQLKARLLKETLATQVIRESTLANVRSLTPNMSRREKSAILMQSQIAWTLSTAGFYKAGGRPWKAANIREGVCYVGLVFKRDFTHPNPQMACCAAQMFLNSGDGVVFKGAVGPWYNPIQNTFHLKRDAAKQLATLVMSSYKERVGGKPKELFLHGRVRFDDEEWRGFEEYVGSETNLVGVRIRDEANLKLYRYGESPILRGMAYVIGASKAILWTVGWVPRLGTYPGREVPVPLNIEISRGSADIRVVLSDIMSLTKLNYNACIFSDGSPITLKFADAIGEVLTAGPIGDVPPLPFRYYI